MRLTRLIHTKYSEQRLACYPLFVFRSFIEFCKDNTFAWFKTVPKSYTVKSVPSLSVSVTHFSNEKQPMRTLSYLAFHRYFIYTHVQIYYVLPPFSRNDITLCTASASCFFKKVIVLYKILLFSLG